MPIKFPYVLAENAAATSLFWRSFQFLYFFASFNACIDYYCSNESYVTLFFDHVSYLALYLAITLEGVYGLIAAKGKRSFYVDKLMYITKYAITAFELAVVLLVLFQNYKFHSILEAWLNNAKEDSDYGSTGHTFLVYTIGCVVPQLGLWAAYVYISYQYLLYTRRMILF